MLLPRSIAWLPLSVRRFAFSRLWQEEYEALRRKRLIESAEGYSFRPFLDHQCIFVHIPKVAGISVATSLFGNLAGGHTSVGIYQIIFSKDEFARYFKFTFVRNPWDRIFSAYNFLQRGGLNNVDRRWAAENLSSFTSFGEFVRKWVSKCNAMKYVHFVPQYKYLCLPYRREPAVDFVGYFENLAEDFNFVQQRIFKNSQITLSHKNKTNAEDRLDYKDYFDEETRRIIADVYDKDIELFGYNFDNTSLPEVLRRRRMP